MKTVQFLSSCSQIEQIIKGLTLTKSLKVSSILFGEPFTGKKSLVESIFPHTATVDAKYPQELAHALEQHDELVIHSFESIPNFDRYTFTNKRIIAIADSTKIKTEVEDKFAFIYHMPALRDRAEDIKLLVSHFSKQIKEELMIDKMIELDINKLNLSDNIRSLKASIYRELVTSDLDKEELENLIYTYLHEHIGGNNAYREHIGIFERPLIKAGLDKYRSQLKLSSVLGLNRNTLRKKIYEHHLD